MTGAVHVAAAIIVREGRVLAARRSGTHGGAGMWEFPGGKVEPGETPEAAVAREVAEELGLRLQTRWPLDTVEHDYPDFHLVMDCLVCPLEDAQEPRLTEHSEVRWLGRNELPDVEWLEADRKVALMLGMYWDQIFAAEHL